MEIVGKIVEFSPIESGSSERGPWRKQTVAIVTLEQNPQYVAFTVMGGRLDEVAQFAKGQVVKVRFGVSSRKVGERWFSDIQLWQMNAV